MKFIEVREGFSIAIDKIEAIETIDGFTCKVFTHLNSYTANFPYSVLLQLLEMQTDKKDDKQEQLLNIAKTMGHYAG